MSKMPVAHLQPPTQRVRKLWCCATQRTPPHKGANRRIGSTASDREETRAGIRSAVWLRRPGIMKAVAHIELNSRPALDSARSTCSHFGGHRRGASDSDRYASLRRMRACEYCGGKHACRGGRGNCRIDPAGGGRYAFEHERC